MGNVKHCSRDNVAEQLAVILCHVRTRVAGTKRVLNRVHVLCRRYPLEGGFSWTEER